MKKTVFKVFLMALVATSLLASCKKNDTQNKDTFTANIEGNDSKTYLSGLDVKWSANDQIKVSNSESTNITFELTQGGGRTKGTFYTGDSGKEAFFTAGGPYTAVYPAINPSDTANAISGTKATIYLPQEQRLIPAQTTTDGSSTLAGETGGLTFGVGYNPMVAYSASQTLPFHNLLGGLCFPLTGAGTGSDTFHITKIVLTAINPADILWGKAEVECNPANANYLEMDLTNSKGSKHQLTLICDIDLPSSEVHKFFFMLPPGTLTWGLNVKVYDGEAVLYEEESDWHETPESPILCNQLQLTNPNMVIGRIPSVTTSTSSNLKALEVTFSGTVDDNGGDLGGVTERGFCWSTTNPPTIADNYVEVGSGTGSYNIRVTTLNPVTQYYWCAYATNSQGTSYGEVKSFTTMKDGFTKNNTTGDKVYLAPGNLQYQASTKKWRFAENQYTKIGANPGNTTAVANRPTQSDWIDLFGFGTSGKKDGNGNTFQPYETSDANNKYPRGNITNLDYDWAKNNIISNPETGENDPIGTWRTPTWDDLECILNTRTTATFARYARARVAEVRGVIVFPDHYTQPGSSTIVEASKNAGNYQPSTGASGTGDNNFTAAQWKDMQDAGAIFLPVGEYRNNTSVGSSDNYGAYWTGTYKSDNESYLLIFSFETNYYTWLTIREVHIGCFVRPIKPY